MKIFCNSKALKRIMKINFLWTYLLILHLLLILKNLKMHFIHLNNIDALKVKMILKIIINQLINNQLFNMTFYIIIKIKFNKVIFKYLYRM